jgi:D-aminoacyl-tRNA deacylase
VRLVVQRVSRASVTVGDQRVAEIGPGLLILAGVGVDDRADEPALLARKVAHLRIFEDADRKMNRSVSDTGGRVLVVPQFTLYADTGKGRRPSWAGAAPPGEAEPKVEAFAAELEALGIGVERGAFREHMLVDLVNDGPVTIVLEG